MSRAFADAIRTTGFAEEVALDVVGGISVTIYRSLHDHRALLCIETLPGASRRVRYVLAAGEQAAPAREGQTSMRSLPEVDRVARATALLAEPAPERCFASIDELAVAIVRQDKMARRAASAAGAQP